MSLLRESVSVGQSRLFDGGFSVFWPMSGSFLAAGRPCDLGEGVLVEGSGAITAPAAGATWLRFTLNPSPPASASDREALMTQPIELADSQILLRLDQVSFPPGACAWRHVHAGPGIRHLLRGALQLQADDHAQQVRSGDSWFEAANSPVRATADINLPETAFIRFMALPEAYLGKPTIRILDPADADRPRLQATQRYLDQIVSLPQG